MRCNTTQDTLPYPQWPEPSYFRKGWILAPSSEGTLQVGQGRRYLRVPNLSYFSGSTRSSVSTGWAHLLARRPAASRRVFRSHPTKFGDRARSLPATVPAFLHNSYLQPSATTLRKFNSPVVLPPFIYPDAELCPEHSDLIHSSFGVASANSGDCGTPTGPETANQGEPLSDSCMILLVRCYLIARVSVERRRCKSNECSSLTTTSPLHSHRDTTSVRKP